MSLYDRPVTDWQAGEYMVSAHTKSRPLYWSRVLKVVIHYTAANKVGTDTARYLRAIQKSYVNNRGYSIGYSYAIDKDGVAWELRGTAHIPAATKNHNGDSIAILMLTDGQEPASEVMVQRARDIIAEANRLTGRNLPIGGHRDYGATQCPGEGNYALIKSGAFKPTKGIINKGAPLSLQDINTEEVDMKIIEPKRILDTRSGRRLNDGETIVVDAGVPGAKAVAVNLTVVESKSGGFLTAWGEGDRPNVSNLNYPGGLICCNMAIVPLDADGKFRIYAHAGTHVLADVQAVLSSSDVVSAPAPITEPTPVIDYTRPTVKQGMRNNSAVKEMQTRLTQAGYRTYADGWFGTKTAQSLRAFQSAHNLVADAICGPVTWRKLIEVTS